LSSSSEHRAEAEYINGAIVPIDGGASAVLPETLLR
jgi:hypothetical protein